VPLYKSTESIAAHGLLSYSGQNVPILRKKLLMLIQSNQQWQLSSIPLEYVIPSNDEPTTAIIPDQTVEWSLELKTPSTNQLGIYQDDFGEILVFNKVTGIIYQVFQHEIHTESSSLISIQQPLLIKLVVGFFIFVVLGIAIKLIKQQISAKNIARKDFAKITLADDKNNIELFRRHVKVPSIIIPIREVDQYQVCLGQEVLSTINRQPNKGFNSKQEERLRELFRIEQIAKMVDGKIRRISIVFTNKHNSKFTVCLYFRQGSERITKKNYFDVVDDIIQWCWLLAEKLNPSQTGSKPINDVGNKNSSNLTEHNSIDNSPLHAQAAIIRPATHPQSNKNYHPRQVKQNVTTAEPIEQSNSTNKKIAQPHTQETDVVNALEKLVTLQQQGFLTALEFKQAKAKLLDGFTSKIT
jgi:hypothetical protein